MLERFELSDLATERLDPNTPPPDAVGILAQPDTIIDLVNFFAHALPPREGICWAAAMNGAWPKTEADAAEVLGLIYDWVGAAAGADAHSVPIEGF